MVVAKATADELAENNAHWFGKVVPQLMDEARRSGKENGGHE
jgi:hypothetical protein